MSNLSFFLMECGSIVDHSNIENEGLKLVYSINDLGRVVEFFQELHETSLMSILTSDYQLCADFDEYTIATRSNFIATFSDFVEQSKTSDIRVFYFAGHGFVSQGELYLVPMDYRARTPEETSISLSYVVEKLSELTGESIIFLDCCRNSGLVPTTSVDHLKSFSVKLSQKVHILLGCSDGQYCYELGVEDVQGGIFTKSILEVLSNIPDACTLGEFFDLVSVKQSDLVRRHIRNRPQTPNLWSVSQNKFCVGKTFQRSGS